MENGCSGFGAYKMLLVGYLMALAVTREYVSYSSPDSLVGFTKDRTREARLSKSQAAELSRCSGNYLYYVFGTLDLGVSQVDSY